MTQELSMLKTDLGIMQTDAYDTRLQDYLDNARAEITREGIALDPADLADVQLVVMYAAWTWRKRDSGDGMPRMLRYALNNRLFAQKAR